MPYSQRGWVRCCRSLVLHVLIRVRTDPRDTPFGLLSGRGRHHPLLGALGPSMSSCPKLTKPPYLLPHCHNPITYCTMLAVKLGVSQSLPCFPRLQTSGCRPRRLNLGVSAVASSPSSYLPSRITGAQSGASSVTISARKKKKIKKYKVQEEKSKNTSNKVKGPQKNSKI